MNAQESKEIYAKVEMIDGYSKQLLPVEERVVTLVIDNDSRSETWDTLVFEDSFGSFVDIAGFDRENTEIIRAIDEALKELKEMRIKSGLSIDL